MKPDKEDLSIIYIAIAGLVIIAILSLLTGENDTGIAALGAAGVIFLTRREIKDI